MKALAILFFSLFSSHAHASEPTALTFSLRGMIGASARFEHPLGERVVLLEEVGASGWLIYGDDPSQGSGQSPTLLRPHVKLGVDYVLPSEGSGRWYFGPRVVGAGFLYADGSRPIYEAAGQGTFGRKWDWKRTRFQVGGGLGVHYLNGPADALTIPLPHVELRLGPILGRRG